MANSRIFPKVMGDRIFDNAPVAALIVGSVVGFAVIVILTRFYMDTLSIFYNVTLLLAYIFYVPQCVGFIVLRRKMGNIPRNYRSPVGITGAVYAIFMFTVGIVACLFLQEDNYATIYMFVTFWGACSAVYVFFVRYRQTFSAEEKEVMFVAHVANECWDSTGQACCSLGFAVLQLLLLRSVWSPVPEPSRE